MALMLSTAPTESALHRSAAAFRIDASKPVEQTMAEPGMG